MDASSKDPYLNIRKRLSFRAWHRGTREMDHILGSFSDTYVSDMNEKELEQFDQLLQIGDPQLYNWYLGKEELPANLRNSVFEKYLSHKVVA
tara:strand:+ start:231 stop:506 length:276 start_codon:yes stop_codon:yes gene_type:complete